MDQDSMLAKLKIDLAAAESAAAGGGELASPAGAVTVKLNRGTIAVPSSRMRPSIGNNGTRYGAPAVLVMAVGNADCAGIGSGSNGPALGGRWVVGTTPAEKEQSEFRAKPRDRGGATERRVPLRAQAAAQAAASAATAEAELVTVLKQQVL